MVGTCDIVADRFGSVGSQEDRSGMFDLWQQLHRTGRHHLEVLRCNLIHQLNCLIHRGSHNNSAPLFDRLAGDLLSRECSQIRLYFITHTICQLTVGRDKDGTGHLIVFCLREQIDRQEILSGALIRQDADLAWSCDHIDIHFTVNQLFRCRHEDITRSCNHIHFRDRLCTVCHRSDRRCTTDFENFRHTAEVTGGQQQLIDLIIRCRSTNDDLFNACDNSRYGIHQQRTGISSLPSGNIESRTVDRCYLLPQYRAILLKIDPGFWHQLLMIRFDTIIGKVQRFTEFAIYRIIGSLHLIG